MALQKGEKYQCPDPECACEIEVIKGANSKAGDLAPRCCCGREMRKV